MSNETQYYDSNFTFISPIRYFKANDPYYYEVDNIPIKQLEENDKFIKDQIDGLITFRDNLKIEIDRTGFTELQPYANGNDRKVRVKPGKYTARINNAFNITPLQMIEQVAGYSNTMNDGAVADVNTWETDTNIGSTASAVLQTFQDGLLGDALNMNGLAERAFTFPIPDEDGIDYSFAGAPNLLNISDAGQYADYDSEITDPDQRPLYPNYIGALFKSSTPETKRRLKLIDSVFTNGEMPDAGAMARLESDFIKRWRGAIRTSIVDVPEELFITVPDFDTDDFFYYDSNGARQELEANQRIDLVFIYSKAVDESGTTIPKFDSNGNPTTITKPTLGILKGAGIGVNRETTTNPNAQNTDDRVDLQTLDGLPVMLAHPGDENGENTGFSSTTVGRIKGSFPSPDDLLNLAPVLSENLETDSLALIGQSILPVAYVIVRRPDSLSITSDPLSEDDIIDIRPFFRTTELTYNERAGIAAATPQVSIANPVATESHVEKIRKEVYGSINSRIETIEERIGVVEGEQAINCRTIAAGNVLGGIYAGPEGVMLNALTDDFINSVGGNFNDMVDRIELELGYPAGSISWSPQWDLASWRRRSTVADRFTGNRACDRINVAHGAMADPGNSFRRELPPWKGDHSVSPLTISGIQSTYSPDGTGLYAELTASDFRLRQPTGETYNDTGDGLFTPPTFRTGFITGPIRDGNFSVAGNNCFFFVKKTIRLNFANTPWVKDFHVDAQLLNCTPKNNSTDPDAQLPGRSSGVFVEKGKDWFTIYVAWAPETRLGEAGFRMYPWANRNRLDKFASFFTIPTVLGNGEYHPWQGWNRYRHGTVYSDTGKLREVGANGVHLNQQRTAILKESGRDYGDTENDARTSNGATGSRTVALPAYFDHIRTVAYPSISWKVTGLSEAYINASNGTNPARGGARMDGYLPRITCI
jgi:hypothetical protein